MPISIVFRQPVSASLHKPIEKHLEVTTSAPVTAAWHWFGTRRVDLRPRSFWTPGTTVSLSAHLGSSTYTRHFTIGADVRTHVYVKKHKTVVTKNGTVIRTMRSDAGSPSWPTWTGTMAVVNKARTVRMDSCSVHIACSPSDPNYYDLELPWDVRITWSGTFLHYSSGDPYPGHGNGSHGCVHLSLKDAEWFYHQTRRPSDSHGFAARQRRRRQRVRRLQPHVEPMGGGQCDGAFHDGAGVRSAPLEPPYAPPAHR
jgi:lipoprotein-anchoring transpeptidase ErfK/SrfK